MAKLLLGNSKKVALVDEEFATILSQYAWHLSNHGYVVTSIGGKKQFLHRFVMGAKDPKLPVDHINGDPLDNRKVNLRIVTHAQNSQNSRKKLSKTGFLGVYYDKGYIKAGIKINGKRKHLGQFTDIVEAALAYDNEARKVFGPDARTNFKLLQEMLKRLDPDGPKEGNDL